MKNIFSHIAAFIIVINFPAVSQESRWYKGNIHTHTTNSDGDVPPRQAVRWYQDHSYNFLVITDHDTLTDPRNLDTDNDDDFLLIPGEELSDRAEGKPIHLNGIGIKNQVTVHHGSTKLETIQNNVEVIRAAGGIPQINHPNWKYAFNDSVLSRVRNAALVEIYNISKECNNDPAGGKPGMEELWDRTLSSGTMIYGTITDDTHDYTGEFTSDKSNPGRGWIMVRAKELTRDAIVASIENGDFYGSIGVVLNDIVITDKEYTVEIKPWGDAKYTTQFIGKDGKVLKEDYNLSATYQFNGGEGYVRARVICSSGDFAITQPVSVQ